MEMNKHKLTKEQAERLGLKEGDVIEYDSLYKDGELHVNLQRKNRKIAHNVFYNGKWVMSLVDLTESEE